MGSRYRRRRRACAFFVEETSAMARFLPAHGSQSQYLGYGYYTDYYSYSGNQSMILQWP